MIVREINEGPKISYEVDGTKICFDDDLSLNLAKLGLLKYFNGVVLSSDEGCAKPDATLFARLFGQADDMHAGGGFLRSAFYGGRIIGGMTVGLAAKGVKAIGKVITHKKHTYENNSNGSNESADDGDKYSDSGSESADGTEESSEGGSE